MNTNFDYYEAFSRNLGFVSSESQDRLRKARVAIAGLGGTGGAQVHALARLGVGGFNLADPDHFELVNFNRQSGASMDTIGHLKTEVARRTVESINPDAKIALFSDGISEKNIDAFLKDVDVVVDSLDFYCFEERFLLYSAARKRGLWVLTAPPLGFGFTLLAFDPHGMAFEEYFGFHPRMTERERVVALIAGIAPKPYLLRYMDRTRPKVADRRLPSVSAAPFLIAGVIATEVARLITGKGNPACVPKVCQFDALLYKFRIRTYYFGMRGPIQRIKRFLLNKMLPR